MKFVLTAMTFIVLSVVALFVVGLKKAGANDKVVPKSAVTINRRVYDETTKRVYIDFEIDKAKVLATAQRTEIYLWKGTQPEIKVEITIIDGSKQTKLNSVSIKSGTASCFNYGGQDCLYSSLTSDGQKYVTLYFSEQVHINPLQPDNSAEFGIFSPNPYGQFRLVDHITMKDGFRTNIKYQLKFFYLTGDRGFSNTQTINLHGVQVEPFTIDVVKGSSPGDVIKDSKGWYDQFFSSPYSKFQGIKIQKDQCKSNDGRILENGTGWWVFIPGTSSNVAKTRPDLCFKLTIYIKYQGNIINRAIRTWNAFYFTAQNSSSSTTNLFTNGKFAFRLDDTGPDCGGWNARDCPSFALTRSPDGSINDNGLFEGNAVNAYLTVEPNSYWAFINDVYKKPEGAPPYSQDNPPNSSDINDEALKKGGANPGYSGDNPGASQDDECLKAFEGGFWGKYLIGKPICGVMHGLAAAAIFFAEFSFNFLIYSAGLQ